MTEITVKLKDDVVKEYGEIFIKKMFEKQVEYLGFLHSLDRIEEQIRISGFDYDKELENTREAAWKDYKKDFLN